MGYTLTVEELLFLQDMCLDGEFRCHQRAADAQVRGDYQTAAYEMQVKEQYTNLKRKLLAALHERGNGDVLANMRRLQMSLQDSAPEPRAESASGNESASARSS
jgi:hypothetical protein